MKTCPFLPVLAAAAMVSAACKPASEPETSNSLPADTPKESAETVRSLGEKPNPGFEQGLEGWRRTGGADLKNATASPEAAHAGAAGLRIKDSSPTKDIVVRWQRHPVAPGETWRVQFWARLVEGYGVDVFARFLASDGKEAGDPDGEPFHLTVPKGESEWKPYQFEAQAPQGAVWIEVYVRSNNVAVVTADFDDFTLEKL